RDSKQLSIDDFIEISENRIRSMALIHEYLYESENISFVNFEEYVKRLLSSIKSSFSGLQVQLETDINEANFDIETSISLGLIINELVINAYKHAFTGIENGVIKIKLINEDGFYHLTIQDNGVGIPANIENGKSVGLKIVKLLVSQISGTLTILNDSGAKFVIQFKKITLPNYE
uniref:sensor histidine kinase n=1 Tax=Flavobacterium sp. TaxID=239 RepID=UPI00286E9810